MRLRTPSVFADCVVGRFAANVHRVVGNEIHDVVNVANHLVLVEVGARQNSGQFAADLTLRHAGELSRFTLQNKAIHL